MLRFYLIVLSLLAVLPLQAQSIYFPEVFSVTGVAFNDTLNVRARPDANSADIGDLNPGELVEVLALDNSGNWGQIVWEEGNAWVSTRYLTLTPQPVYAASGMPRAIFCFGTEPFWGAELLEEGKFVMSAFGPNDLQPVQSTTASDGAINSIFAFRTADYIGVLARQSCSDGMSNRTYGWALDLIYKRDSGIGLTSGCCTASLR